MVRNSPHRVLSWQVTQLLLALTTLKSSRVHRVGPFSLKKSSLKSIIVKFMHICDRDKVWAKHSALKGTGLWTKEDCLADIEARHKTLWPYVRAALLGDPKYHPKRVPAFLRVDKLVLDNEVYSSENIPSIPEFVKTRIEKPPTTIRTDPMSIFFTERSHLSNFYRN